MRRASPKCWAGFWGSLVGAMLLLSGAASPQPSAGGFAATVNGVGISTARLEHSFQEYVKDRQMNIARMRSPARLKAMKRETLDILIDQELVWQAAEKAGVLASPEEVEAVVAELRGQFKSDQDFRLRLQTEGFTQESFREHMRHLTSARKYLDRVRAEVTVTDEDVHAFYVDNPDKFTVPEHIRARHILIKVPADADEASRQAARGRAEDVLQQAREGVDFAELAKAHSEDSTAANGGDLGFFARKRMVPVFEEAAFALQPGEISGVVETQFGLHIIKVEERRDGSAASEEQVRDEVRQYLQQVRANEAQEAELDRVRKDAKIEILLPL